VGKQPVRSQRVLGLLSPNTAASGSQNQMLTGSFLLLTDKGQFVNNIFEFQRVVMEEMNDEKREKEKL